MRLFDLSVAIIVGVCLLPFFCLISLLIRLTSPGRAIYWSDRVGLGNRIFRMPKFRTMRIDAPEVATHQLQDPSNWITPVGTFLRSTSLDELPQIWSVIRGDMCLVGPRPALFNQFDLIELRSFYGIDSLKPGITGWAQINGRDTLSIEQKVELDLFYKTKRSFIFDLQIILMTAFKVIGRAGMKH